MPDGSRLSRRFRRSDALQAVFDYVDLAVAAAAPAAAAPAAPRPGGYSLVAQFPRRVLSDGRPGSLADAGLSGDTAFFVEAVRPAA